MSLNAPKQDEEKVSEKIETISSNQPSKDEKDNKQNTKNKKDLDKEGIKNLNNTSSEEKLQNLLNQKSSNVIKHGNMFNDVKIEVINKRVQDLDSFHHYFDEKEIKEIKSNIDAKYDKKEIFSLNDLSDKEIVAILQEQGLTKDQMVMFENKNNLLHFLNTFTDIDNENRTIANQPTKLYPASPSEGLSLSLKNGAVMRYDVAGYINGYESFFKSPQQAILRNLQNEVEKVINKNEETINKENKEPTSQEKYSDLLKQINYEQKGNEEQNNQIYDVELLKRHQVTF